MYCELPAGSKGSYLDNRWRYASGGPAMGNTNFVACNTQVMDNAGCKIK